MYTIQNVIDDMFIWTHRLSPSVGTGRPEMLQLFREAFRKQFDLAVVADTEFFTKKYDFTGVSLVPYQTGHHSVVLVEIPGAASGWAPIYEASEWQRKANNSRTGFTANNPGAKLVATGVQLSDAFNGSLYYTKAYGDAELDNEATDIETLLPRPFIQAVTLEGAFLAKSRILKTMPARASAMHALEAQRMSQFALLHSMYPDFQAEYEQPIPATASLDKK